MLFRLDGEGGSVVAELSAGGANFWVADESPEHSNFSPETLGGGTVRMVMVVENPDAAFNRAVAAGAKRIHPRGEQYGWRLGPLGRSLWSSLGNRKATGSIALAHGPQRAIRASDIQQDYLREYTRT